jgi:DNA polymerase III delta prime subunit
MTLRCFAGVLCRRFGHAQEVVDALVGAGALAVTFNPIPATSLVKALRLIAAAEGYEVSAAELRGVADGCLGDLRCAIETLQLALTGDPGRRKAPMKKVCLSVCLPVCLSGSQSTGKGAGRHPPPMKKVHFKGIRKDSHALAKP